MTYPKKLSNLRKEHIDKKFELRNEPKTGFEILIEFDYLLNVDLKWIIKEIRKAIIEEVELSDVQKKRVILTFDIEEIRSEHSIEMFLTPGIVEGVADFTKGVAIVVVGGLILRVINNLRQKRLSKGTRENIRRIRIRKKTVYPDGRIEYSESEEDSFEVED